METNLRWAGQTCTAQGSWRACSHPSAWGARVQSGSVNIKWCWQETKEALVTDSAGRVKRAPQVQRKKDGRMREEWKSSCKSVPDKSQELITGVVSYSMWWWLMCCAIGDYMDANDAVKTESAVWPWQGSVCYDSVLINDSSFVDLISFAMNLCKQMDNQWW